MYFIPNLGVVICMPGMELPYLPISNHGVGPGRKTNGLTRANGRNKYDRPHSSTRQNARIARQMAAGQLDYSASKFKGDCPAQ